MAWSLFEWRTVPELARGIEWWCATLERGRTARSIAPKGTYRTRSRFQKAAAICRSSRCCGPDRLAVITGTVGEPGPIDEAASTSLPEGVSVIDVQTGAAVHIDVGVFFSPDGRYYFDTGVYEASGSFRLYRTANDQDVTAQLAVPRHHLGPEGGWMPGSDHVLVFIEKPPPRKPGPPETGDTARGFRGARRMPQVYPDRWNLTVDAETGQVIDRFQGDLGAGWKTNAAALPVERRTGIALVPARRP